jgi:hypothetical protein
MYVRSLLKPETMAGATEEEIAALIPDSWSSGPAKKGFGTRWLSTKNGKYGQVRYFPNGSPKVGEPLHDEAYADVTIGGLEYRFAAAGNSVLDNPDIADVQIGNPGKPGAAGPNNEQFDLPGVPE